MEESAKPVRDSINVLETADKISDIIQHNGVDPILNNIF